MKNIQVIDGAINATYDIYAASEEDFKYLFPLEGQDIQFICDIPKSSNLTAVLHRLWKHRVNKKEVNGIHGTLFYELEFKRSVYPNRKENDNPRWS